jgi:hypothetical protein
VGFFGRAVAVQDQHLVVHPGGRAARQHPRHGGADHRPDVGEPNGAGTAERGRVDPAGERGEGVVVERDELGPDPQQHRLR